jgi:hypothetical protein
MAVARKNKAPRTPRASALDPTPRHLWLASLGVLVAARRESGAVVARAGRKLEDTVADAHYAIRRAGSDLRAGIDGVLGQVEPRVQKLGSEVEARLAPIVARFGLKPKPVRKTRARKPGKRTARKASR